MIGNKKFGGCKRDKENVVERKIGRAWFQTTSKLYSGPEMNLTRKKERKKERKIKKA